MNLQEILLNKDKTPVVQSFKVIKAIEDKKGRVKEKKVTEKREIILRDIIEKSLLNTNDDDLRDYDLKLKKYELFTKIRDVEEYKLSDEEKKLLTRAICQVYDVFFAGQSVALIQ